MPLPKPLVTVICTTYNHGAYVRQALEGFLIQECDYPFEVLVHDDASTDDTASVIREYADKYPGLFRTILQMENQYSKGMDIWSMLIANHSEARYIAFCEGDDYWTDPLKLQKQIDYLESHLDCGLVYTRALTYVQNRQKFTIEIGRQVQGIEEVLRANPVTTLTAVVRRSQYLRYIEEVKPAAHNWKMSDYPLWIYLAAAGGIHFIPQVTGVYRILPESASNSRNIEKMVRFFENCYSIRLFFAQRYTPHNIDWLYELKLSEMLSLACVKKDNPLRREVRRKMQEHYLSHPSGHLRIAILLSCNAAIYLLSLYLYRKIKQW